jgi:hypothetical protein
MGTAPAFGRALAPCDGSDLLPLRLLSICSWVTRFYAPPQLGGFASFARLARSPLRRVPFAPRSLRAGPFGGVDPPEHCAASWLYSSNHNPLGNCINAGPETGLAPDSTRTRFLTSRLVAQLLCRKTGSAATPSWYTPVVCQDLKARGLCVPGLADMFRLSAAQMMASSCRSPRPAP